LVIYLLVQSALRYIGHGQFSQCTFQGVPSQSYGGHRFSGAKMSVVTLSRLYLTEEIMSESTPPPVTVIEITAGFAFDGEPIESVAVSLVHAKRRHDVVLRRDSARAFVELAHDPQKPLLVTYQYVVHFMQTPSGRVDPLTSPERKTDSRIIVIPGRELYQLLQVQLISAIRFDQARQVAVEVRPGACPHNVVTAHLDEGRREWAYRWVIDRDGPVDYDYRVSVDPGNGEIRRGEWQHSDSRVLFISEHATT
jgi:hypothetical protein